MNDLIEQRARGRRFLIAGGIVLILTGMAHAIAELSPPPAPAGEEEASLLRLMETHVMDIMGVKLTMMSIFHGFGWCFSACCWFLAATAIGIAAMRPRDAGLVRAASVFLALAAAVLLLISILYFPPPPIAFFAAAVVLFIIAATRAAGARAA